MIHMGSGSLWYQTPTWQTMIKMSSQNEQCWLTAHCCTFSTVLTCTSGWQSATLKGMGNIYSPRYSQARLRDYYCFNRSPKTNVQINITLVLRLHTILGFFKLSTIFIHISLSLSTYLELTLFSAYQKTFVNVYLPFM